MKPMDDKAIATRKIYWMDERGRLWPLVNYIATIFIDPANLSHGHLADGREVFKKPGCDYWVYMPTGEYLPDGTMIKRP